MKRAGMDLELEIAATPSPINRKDGVRDLQFTAFVVQLVASSTGVGAKEIASARRQNADAARARQVAMYLTHIAFEWPLGRVATAFGRDRSTISYACRRVEDLREDVGFDKVLQRLESCVRAAPFCAAPA